MSGAQKRGLGRGLGALLGEQAASEPSGERVREIPVSSVTPNPFQPRKHFDSGALGELQASIAEYGVLVPIIVREKNGGYELIAGERRWRACAALRRATVPAIVRPADDRGSLEVAIVENLQREDLNPLEEAAGFATLLDEYAFTQEELARRLGKSRPAIANALRLLSLADPIKALIADGRLTAGHARALLAAPENARAGLARRAVEDGLSVRALERLAAAAGSPAAPVRAARTLSAEHRAFEAQLRGRVGAHVALKPRGKGGKIEIRYTSERDLIRIADVLLGIEQT